MENKTSTGWNEYIKVHLENRTNYFIQLPPGNKSGILTNDGVGITTWEKPNKGVLGPTGATPPKDGSRGAAPGGNDPPVDGDTWIDGDKGETYVYSTADGWEQAPCCGARNTIGPPGSVPPEKGSTGAAPGGQDPPRVGDEWVDADTGSKYIYNSDEEGWQPVPCCNMDPDCVTGPGPINIEVGDFAYIGGPTGLTGSSFIIPGYGSDPAPINGDIFCIKNQLLTAVNVTVTVDGYTGATGTMIEDFDVTTDGFTGSFSGVVRGGQAFCYIYDKDKNVWIVKDSLNKQTSSQNKYFYFSSGSGNVGNGFVGQGNYNNAAVNAYIIVPENLTLTGVFVSKSGGAAGSAIVYVNDVDVTSLTASLAVGDSSGTAIASYPVTQFDKICIRSAPNSGSWTWLSASIGFI